MRLPGDWSRALGPELAPVWDEVSAFVARERAAARVHPPDSRVAAAFEATPFEAVKVVLLGQDPYPNAGQACGLSFSVLPGTPAPASLLNLFRERETDLGMPLPPHGWLGAWAERGVLLLNTVLTVRDGEPGSHSARGWERFTDLVLDALNARRRPCVFVLLGGPARKKRARLTSSRHRVFEGVHPSPLSANTGFFGSRLFSAVNGLLAEVGQDPIDWSLPDDPGTVEVVRDRDPSLDALSVTPAPPSALGKLLDLPVWRALDLAEAREVADAVGHVLPAAFTFTGVEPGPRGPRVGWRWRDRDFVLVPGASVELGWKGVKAKLSTPRRRAFEAAAGAPPEQVLGARSSPVRAAVIPPFLAAVDARPVREWVPSLPGGPDPVAAVDAALRAQGLALPTPDAWEYLHSAGERTWFWWGMEWPGDRPGAPETPFGTRFRPDALHPEWTVDPWRWVAGADLPPGAEELLWAPSLSGDALARRGLPRPGPDVARIRPVRPIFPYAVR